MPRPNWHVGSSSKYQRRSRGYALITVSVVAVVVLLIGACSTAFYRDEHVRVTVDQKESVAKDGGHEYRVYTDKGTFVMEDSVFKLRTATSDDYAKVREGRTYDCKAFGWRIPLFSMFKNLHGCHEVR